MVRLLATASCLVVLVLASLGVSAPARADDLVGYTFVHDPSMIKQGNTYYVFSTGDPNGSVGNGNIQIRTSTDLRHWRYRGTVFSQIPNWVTLIVGTIPNLWAPDISYWHGLYHLYYAGSSFGTNNSVIGLATNVTLDPSSPSYHWVDRGLVVQSTSADDWNAIDPNLALDAHGHPWLAFGSFWTGIKMRRIDPASGKLAKADTSLYALAYRSGSNAIEAASIIYRKPYYYLFVSFDFCCRGVKSTYRIMVGRARAITGPYADRAGHPMSDGGGTQVLASQGRFRGPGGETVVRDGTRFLLAHHYYDADDNGNAKLEINPIAWTTDGWPKAGPPLTT